MFIVFQAKIETKALKAKRPGFTDDRYNETEYYVENGKYNFFNIKYFFRRSLLDQSLSHFLYQQFVKEVKFHFGLSGMHFSG